MFAPQICGEYSPRNIANPSISKGNKRAIKSPSRRANNYPRLALAFTPTLPLQGKYQGNQGVKQGKGLGQILALNLHQLLAPALHQGKLVVQASLSLKLLHLMYLKLLHLMQQGVRFTLWCNQRCNWLHKRCNQHYTVITPAITPGVISITPAITLGCKQGVMVGVINCVIACVNALTCWLS